ncbi:glycosyl transferase family protein [Qipengyuania marisflavi]|uniref:Glycosyl transferase family protein n=1 Tax=Qipengyuania marisflavi TaxID=2486356 RepID=A0A5S3P661_9SPHN|nr:glycosyl transferase family protein [Qipengyuania marisflavi]TMM48711.1 glycosyl transferase family protein [Qipengyuania marisflavi]
MPAVQFSAAEWLLVAQYELLLFAACFFALGALDELVVDCSYFWLRLTGKARTPKLEDSDWGSARLAGRAAVFIPAWQESAVIGPTISHALTVWQHAEMTIYVGCYRNDPHTIASAMVAARGDVRVRVVIHAAQGPTSKADCLNRLYAALCEDEARSGELARMVVLHDAEDMVDPAGLAAMDQALWHADFIQLPVLALPQGGSRWIASHYSDEFAEAHGKTMVVRGALGAALPGAGVGSAIARTMLGTLDRKARGDGPFARESLTEDYELGFRIAALGGSSHFLRARAADGRLIATRAYFPAQLSVAVRQKTRWMHGIALQSWDRLGWSGGAISQWMQLRDRRGPLAAILLAIAYMLVATTFIGLLASNAGLIEPPPLSPLVEGLLAFNIVALAWRFIMRAVFTGREYGVAEGLRAIPRMFISNIIAIMAGRRALSAYLSTLRGAPVVWDKTEHRDHPALSRDAELLA